jgi:hypothetical protein
MLQRDRQGWRRAIGWSALALLSFYAADPAIWPNPVARLGQSLAFSASYSSGTLVAVFDSAEQLGFEEAQNRLANLSKKYPHLAFRMDKVIA